MPSYGLGKREADIMNVLWNTGGGTVAEVLDALRADDLDIAYTTIQTMLNRLEAKGHVTRTLEGRAYRYTPTLRQPAAAGEAVQSLIDRFFRGSAESLAKHLVERDLSEDELARIENLIARHREKGDPS